MGHWSECYHQFKRASKTEAQMSFGFCCLILFCASAKVISSLCLREDGMVGSVVFVDRSSVLDSLPFKTEVNIDLFVA